MGLSKKRDLSLTVHRSSLVSVDGNVLERDRELVIVHREFEVEVKSQLVAPSVCNSANSPVVAFGAFHLAADALLEVVRDLIEVLLCHSNVRVPSLNHHLHLLV